MRIIPFFLIPAQVVAMGCVIHPVEEARPAGPVPIRSHPHDPRYLEYQGKPVILITAGEHYGAVLNLDFDYSRYLATLHQDGLNYTRIFTGTYVEREGSFGILRNSLAPVRERLITPWARSEEPGYIHGGNKFDLSKWDPAYFERLRDFIRKAGEFDIIVEVTLFSSIYSSDHWQMSPLHPSNNVSSTPRLDYRKVNTLDNEGLFKVQEEFVRKMVRELNSFDNLFFEIQNEPYADHSKTVLPLNPLLPDWNENWMNRVDIADQASLEWQDRIGQVIQKEEQALPKKHLIAQNFCNFKFPLSAVPDGVSIMNFHYAMPETVTWNYGWKKVASFDESGFSGTDDATYRRQAWRFILAGGGVFNQLDYSFYPGAEDGTGKNQAPGGGSAELRRQLGILKDFIHQFDFVYMGPDRSVVRRAPGSLVQVLAARGRSYALYIEAMEGPREYELTLNLMGGPYVAEWIDPASGKLIRRDHPEEAWEATLKSPEFSDDMALKIVPEND